MCDEIITVMDIVSTKMTNIIATNVSITCPDKKLDIKLIAVFCIQFY